MSATVLKNPVLEPSVEVQTEQQTSEIAPTSLLTLTELTMRLIRELQCIGEVRPVSFDEGLDFYDEVTRFEIDLIKRALLLTAGHQGRAARLLNLRATTLNSKIKHYGIDLHSIPNGFTFADSSLEERRPHV